MASDQGLCNAIQRTNQVHKEPINEKFRSSIEDGPQLKMPRRKKVQGPLRTKGEAAAAAEEGYPSFRDLFQKDPIAAKLLSYWTIPELTKLRGVSKTFRFAVESNLARRRTIDLGECLPMILGRYKWMENQHESFFSRGQLNRTEEVIEWLSKYCPKVRELPHYFLEPRFFGGFENLTSVKFDLNEGMRHSTVEGKLNAVVRRKIWKATKSNQGTLEELAIKRSVPGNFSEFFERRIPDNLTSLDLSRTCMEMQTFKQWFTPGGSVPLPIEQLRELRFPVIYRGLRHNEKIGAFLKRGLNLELISAPVCLTEVFEFAAAFGQLPKLVHFMIPYFPFASYDTGKDLSRLFSTCGHRLRHLGLGCWKHTGPNVGWDSELPAGVLALQDLQIEILEATPHLTSLTLFPKESLASLHPTLLLNLSSLKVGSIRAAPLYTWLCTWLNTSLPNLQELELSLNLPFMHLAESGDRIDRPLERLRVSFNGIFYSFTKLLGPNVRRTLIELEISEERFTGTPTIDRDEFQAFFEECPKLEKVRLPYWLDDVLTPERIRRFKSDY